jgi:segregation and condensation protein B
MDEKNLEQEEMQTEKLIPAPTEVAEGEIQDLEDILETEEEFQTPEVISESEEEVQQLEDSSETAQEVQAAQESSETEEAFSLDLEFADPEKQEEKDWKDRTGLDEDSLCGALETLIFMNDRPVSLIKLRNMIDPMMPLRMVHQSMERLQADYEVKHHGIRLQEVAEGYQFRTKATYAKFVQELFKVQSMVLSPTALEVLAILAYKQPISRAEIDRIRGVDSSHIVRALMDKRLVKVTGRSEDAGRPVVYSTTSEFLEVFNLRNLEDLPPEYELESMIEKNEVGKISDIREIVTKGDKGKFKFDEIDELDELQGQIKSIQVETSFLKDLRSQGKKKEEEGPKKSAYDLLEEYAEISTIEIQNRKSCSSELISHVIEPTVVHNLLDGPFNIPEILDEDEESELIPLEEIAVAQDEEQEDGALFEETQLDEALDEVFGAMKSNTEKEDDLEDSDEQLAEFEEDLAAKTQKLSENYPELGLDTDSDS